MMQKDKNSLLKELRANASACVMSMAVADGYIKTVIEGDNRVVTDNIVRWLKDGSWAKYFLAKVQEIMYSIVKLGYIMEDDVQDALDDTVKTLKWAIGLHLLPNGSCFAIEEREDVDWSVLQNVDENVRNLMHDIMHTVNSATSLGSIINKVYISQQINIMMSDIFIARSIWKHRDRYNEDDLFMEKSKMLSIFLVRQSNDSLGSLLESKEWKKYERMLKRGVEGTDNFYMDNMALIAEMIGVCIKGMIVSDEIDSSLGRKELQRLVDQANDAVETYMDGVVDLNTDIEFEKDFIDSMEEE